MAQVLLTDTDRAGMSLTLDRQLQATDLTIVCREGRVVRAHQAVFAWGSSWLRRVFMSQFLLEDGGKRKEEVTLHLPGFSVQTVTAVARFLTCGELRIALSTAGREEIEEAFKKVDKEGLGKLNKDQLKTLMISVEEEKALGFH